MDEDDGPRGEEQAQEANASDTLLTSLAVHEALAMLPSGGKSSDPAPRVFARVSSKLKAGSEASGSALQGPSTKDREAMVSVQECGDSLFSAQKYGEAATAYTEALRYAHDADDVATLLSNRSASYASLSRTYRGRPARTSEYHALFDLDPTSLAQMALKDAERAVAVRPNWAKTHSRKGAALFLLERFYEAREAYLEGLALEPTNSMLQEGMREVQAVLAGDGETEGTAAAAAAGTAPFSAKRQRSFGGSSLRSDLDDWDCSLCAQLLFEPVTTPCGHTFCRECFARAMDHRPRCPYCRTVLHVARDSLPVTITLANIISRAFPEEYEQRRVEMTAGAGGPVAGEGAAASGDGAATAAAGTAPEAVQRTLTLPLFVMSLLMPGESMALNIFEPRYRLMVRRVMEGSRRLGMAQARRDASEIEDVAVEAEIIECQPQPDGRYYLELVGRRRVRIHSHSEMDGYRVARCEVMQDTEPGPDTAEREALPELVTHVDRLVERLLNVLRTHSGPRYGRQGLRMQSALEGVGERPPPDQAERFSMWAATVTALVIPDLDKLSLLRSTDTGARLRQLHMQLGTWMGDLMTGTCSSYSATSVRCPLISTRTTTDGQGCGKPANLKIVREALPDGLKSLTVQHLPC
ncbi:hypothetical protein VaNZ11_008336 [Volvox africanus]|uniref:Uncharacterized protein n=1 Tax=Volvox africanus TaxID=51714 RepID=A0ABQ5S4V8_9CHLO|nr:hypothetical protein VaNZ11_008336 [Volvox africanus]